MGGSGNTSQIVAPLLMVFFLGLAAYRRTRPQPVRAMRTLLFTALIVLAALAGLAANPAILRMPLFLALAPVMLVVGLGLGWVMMRQIRFWCDGATGQVWMAGGAAYVAIWLATLVLRLGIEWVARGSAGTPARSTAHPSVLATLASALLFLSVGLWLMRGAVLVRRAREHARD